MEAVQALSLAGSCCVQAWSEKCQPECKAELYMPNVYTIRLCRRHPLYLVKQPGDSFKQDTGVDHSRGEW